MDLFIEMMRIVATVPKSAEIFSYGTTVRGMRRRRVFLPRGGSRGP